MLRSFIQKGAGSGVLETHQWAPSGDAVVGVLDGEAVSSTAGVVGVAVAAVAVEVGAAGVTVGAGGVAAQAANMTTSASWANNRLGPPKSRRSSAAIKRCRTVSSFSLAVMLALRRSINRQLGVAQGLGQTVLHHRLRAERQLRARLLGRFGQLIHGRGRPGTWISLSCSPASPSSLRTAATSPATLSSTSPALKAISITSAASTAFRSSR